MKVGQQPAASFCVPTGNGFALFGDVLAQAFQCCLQGLTSITQHARLNDAPRCIGFLSFLKRRLCNIPANPGADFHKSPGLKVHQGLADQGAADLKQVRNVLFTQFLSRTKLGCQDRLYETLGDLGFGDDWSTH